MLTPIQDEELQDYDPVTAQLGGTQSLVPTLSIPLWDTEKKNVNKLAKITQLVFWIWPVFSILPACTAEPELNVYVALSPNWKILILAHYLPLISTVALKLHTVLFSSAVLTRLENSIACVLSCSLIGHLLHQNKSATVTRITPSLFSAIAPPMRRMPGT